MSDICSGPLVIIPNIDGAKFALSAPHLACHAGFGLSNIKMNTEPTTMKRPPSDELIEAVETKKVKLREDSERPIDELTTADNKEKDSPIEKRVNGNSKSEDADSKQLSAENTSLCNGVHSKGIKTEDVNRANDIVSAKINNDIDDCTDSTNITVDNSEEDTPSEVSSCHVSANDNIDEAPTLEDIDISDESLNTSKGTNPCDISNSDVNISACVGATAPVDISDNVTNHSKTELELVHDLIVETPTLSTPSDVINHNTSDLIASKENELSCSKINSKILKEELAIKTPTMDESEVEKTNLKRTKVNDAHVSTSSLDKKALEVSDGEIKSEKNVSFDGKVASVVADCNSEDIPLNIDHTNSNKELCSDLMESEGNKVSNSSKIEGVELKTLNDLAKSDDPIIEDSENSKETLIDGEISSEKSVIPVVIELKKRDDSNVVGVSSSKLTDNVEDDKNNPIVVTKVTESLDNDVKKENDIISGNTDFVDEPSLAVKSNKMKHGDADNDSKMDSLKRGGVEKSNTTQENELKSVKPDDIEVKNESDGDEPVAKKIKLDDSSNDLNLKNVETTSKIKGIEESESKEKDVKTQIINDSKLPTDISKEDSKNISEVQGTKKFKIEGTLSNNENAKVDCKDITTETLRKESDKPTEIVIEKDSKKDDADLDKMDVPSKQLENEIQEKEFYNKESAIDNEGVCGSNEEFENKGSIEKSTDSVKLNENKEDSLVPNKLTTDAESVDSDIEILDDPAKQSNIVSINASEKATPSGGEDVNVEKTDAITDVTEDSTTADLRDTATPIEGITDASPIDVIRYTETSVNESDDTATPMDTDVPPPPSTVTAASADESSNDSMGLTIDYNEENKENVEEKDGIDDAKATAKEDDDEIIFIKECKKDDACTCVMCYAKNKTPEKSDDKSEEKTEDGEKDKKKKKKIKVPKLTEKFESLTRNDLEKVLSTMFLKVFTYESDLGQLRETVNKMKEENIAMKTLCTAQGKQLKELTHVHERAMAEITAFAADPKREGTLHPVKITRSVGLQVNVSQDKKRPTQPAADKNKASCPVTRSVNGITRPKRMVQRSSPYSSRGRTPNASPSSSPQISPRLRGALTPNYRTARPMGVRPGLRILPPRALNNNMGANRAPWTNNAGRSPTTQMSTRQSPGMRVVTRASAPVMSNTSNKTSGNTTVEFIDLDDDVQPASPKPPMRVVRAAPGTLVRTSTAATIRVATPTSIASANRTAVPGQRLYVPLSQGYKIRAAPSTTNAILTAPSSSAGNTNTTYVLNTPAGPIPFQTNNVRLNIRSNVNASPIRINYQGHPAPVPANVRPTMLPPEASYKIVPASPKLRVQLAQEGRGIQLTWSLDVTSDMAKIESYQLYAYQENKTAPINSSLWKSIGRLDALPLPMACTLTQFTSGHTYHFLVRAVDEFRRFSSFSNPGTIHLKS